MSQNGTIFDYLSWRGDIPFSQQPFNIVDNVVLTFMTYAVFDKVQLSEEENHKGLPLTDYYDRLVEAGGYPEGWDILCSMDELKKICKSIRFGSVVLSDAVDIIDHDRGIQFAAEIFHINDKETYISYRGTDDTLAGWKEDMELSYSKVPAQQLAADYLKKHLDDPGQTYYVGGHSKGAHLAIYAAAYLDDEQLSMVKTVFMNDGPGFNPEILSLERLKRIDEKTIFIRPYYALIGAIYCYPFTHTYTVKSCFKGILQHNAKSWMVRGTHLDTTDSLDPEAVAISEALNIFLSDTSMENRKKFVDDFFDSFSDSGRYKLLSEAKTIDYLSIQRRFIKLAESDKETKAMLVRLPFTMAFSKTLMGLRHAKPVDFFFNNTMIIGFITLALGVGFLFLPFSSFPYVIASGFIVLTAAELILLIYFLFLTKWNFKGQLIRITMIVILTALSVAYFIDIENIAAFSCIILGIGLMILAFSMFGKLLDKSYRGFNMVLAIIEVISLLVGGTYFIIFNDYSLQVISDIIGWIGIADGALKVFMGFYQVIQNHYRKARLEKERIKSVGTELKP